MSRLPTLFISHGSPMLALEPGTTGSVLTRIGQQLPKPKAILVISAHWLTQQPTLTSSAAPETIHDFGGFPRALYALQYPAPGSPVLAAQVQAVLRKIGLDARLDATRGLDHGAWVPLRYLYPDADVPVVQLSLNPSVSPKLQFALGQLLRGLSDEGVLILASGSFTHNLGELHWDRPEELPEAGDPYVDQFRDWVIDKIEKHDIEALNDYRKLAPHARRAHPTDEHLLPLFVALGAADSTEVVRLHKDVALGTLAMDLFAFGSESGLLADPQVSA